MTQTAQSTLELSRGSQRNDQRHRRVHSIHGTYGCMSCLPYEAMNIIEKYTHARDLMRIWITPNYPAISSCRYLNRMLCLCA